MDEELLRLAKKYGNNYTYGQIVKSIKDDILTHYIPIKEVEEMIKEIDRLDMNTHNLEGKKKRARKVSYSKVIQIIQSKINKLVEKEK